MLAHYRRHLRSLSGFLFVFGLTLGFLSLAVTLQVPEFDDDVSSFELSDSLGSKHSLLKCVTLFTPYVIVEKPSSPFLEPQAESVPSAYNLYAEYSFTLRGPPSVLA